MDLYEKDWSDRKTTCLARISSISRSLRSLSACRVWEVIVNVKQLLDFVFFKVISRFFVSTFSLASRSLASSMDSDPGLGP